MVTGPTEPQASAELFDPDGFDVVAAESDGAAEVRRLTVMPTPGGAAGVRPDCGAASADRRACRGWAVVDLPLAGWRIELSVWVRQFA